MLNVVNPYTFDSAILPYRVDVMAWSQATPTGATYNRAQSGSYLGGGAGGLLTGADADNGDSFTFGDVLLAAGTYVATIVYIKASQYGILDVKIDGSSVGTIDLYAASTSNNNVSEFSGIALAAGLHSLTLAANGKNASSGDYMLGIHSVTLTRTGA